MTTMLDPTTGETLIILTEAEHLELVRLLNQARGIAQELEEENSRLIKALRLDVTPATEGRHRSVGEVVVPDPAWDTP